MSNNENPKAVGVWFCEPHKSVKSCDQNALPSAWPSQSFSSISVLISVKKCRMDETKAAVTGSCSVSLGVRNRQIKHQNFISTPPISKFFMSHFI